MSNANITTSPPRACQGFSLFEVLVTVVVVGIGLLGLAGLQFAGLRASNNAQDATYATQLAQEVAERIRANRVAALNGNYSTFSVTATNLNTSDPDCMTNNCTPPQIVLSDLYQLGRRLYPGSYTGSTNPPILTNPSIQVTQLNTQNFVVTVNWGDQQSVQLPVFIQ